jgi:hypothetical protein
MSNVIMLHFDTKEAENLKSFQQKVKHQIYFNQIGEDLDTL